MLNFKQKVIDVSVSEKVLILYLKNGSKQEFLISDVAKIFIEINKRSKVFYAIFFAFTSIIVFVSSDECFLLLSIFLSTTLFVFALYKFKYNKFKFKLIIKDVDQKIHQFGFNYQLKNKIVDSISTTKKQIKL